ncbi:MAG: DUF1178 family protein [Desulfobulbaceae bacterium]|nr:DUF1178 family protein [Desulfobulbaceae bacterium]HIJ77843.1 DUF1178 family protein [Deltaproteobacteria bacterium]
MIVFDLACACGCRFEGWFRDHGQMQSQRERGLLLCPACGGAAVHKILSPVAVKTGQRRRLRAEEDGAQVTREDARHGQAALKIISEISAYVEANFENVGPRLAEETLKMCCGDKKMRNIRGEASPEEESLLKGKGINLLKVPILKKEKEEPPQ